MDSNPGTFKTEYRNITVKTTDGSTLRGRINIGVKERLSDLFTKGETPFLILTDATARDVAGKVLIVNKAHIVWAEPED
jgi:hypothetical protein